MSLVFPFKQLLTRYGAKTMKPVIIIAIAFVLLIPLPIFAQEERLGLTEDEFEDVFVSSEEYTKLLDRLYKLENQTHLHTYQVISYVGILLAFIGFILMLRYWSNPYERHLENWIKMITVLYPKSYERRIKRDFNYWRDYRNKAEPSPDGEWYVPKDFAHYWHCMKLLAFFSIIIGFFLQIFQ